MRNFTPESKAHAPRRRRGMLALALAVFLALPATAAGDYVQRAEQGFFGVNAQGLTQDALSLDATLLDRQASALGNDLGAGWARVPLAWNGAEPVPPVAGIHTYQFIGPDKVVAALARQGVKASLQLGGTPAWATSASNLLSCVSDPRRAAPTNLDAFADFAGTVAKRYGPGGRFWADNPTLPYVPANIEIYNEPNWIGFWCPGPNPAVYAEMLSKAIARVEALAPQTEVLMGGLATVKDGDTRSNGMQTRRFIEEMLATRPTLATQLDAVSLHLYGGAAESNYELLSWFRAILTDNGMGDTPIYLNEFGWPTNGPSGLPLSESERAAELAKMAHTLWRTDCNLAGIAVHTWHTPESNPLDPEDWFGIAHRLTGALYESGRAYRDEIALATGQGEQPAPRSTVQICGGDEPDSDGDGVPDAEDDFPLDPTRSDGSTETNPEDDVEVPEPIHPPRLPSDYFGVERGSLTGSAVAQGTQLDAMQAAGVGRLRITASWRAIEPAAPGSSTYSLDWGYLDSQVYAAAKRGMHPQLQVLEKPTWLPLDSSGIATQYARFMGLVAQRYGQGGSFWRSYPAIEPLPLRDYEVWNGANWGSEWWDGSASPTEYADAITKVRAAVRAVDPAARAVASFTAYGSQATAWDFIRQTGLAVDGVQLSLYGTPGSAGEAVSQLEAALPPLRRALEETGSPNAPISVQTGYATGGSGQISQAERAAAYRLILERVGRSNCGVASVSFRAWNDAVSGFGVADATSAELNASGRAISETARLYTGWTTAQAPRAAVLLCGETAPDRDSDGVPDPEDDHPLDPTKGSADPVPDTTIVSAPARHHPSSTAAFEFSSDVAGSLFLCSVDGQPTSRCEAQHTVEGLADGEHTLTVEAVNSGGRHDPTPAQAQFGVDTEAPATRIEIVRKAKTGPRKLFLSAPGEVSPGFRCSLDDAAFQGCGARYRVPVTLAPGRHELLVTAVDLAGNRDLSPARLGFRIRR